MNNKIQLQTTSGVVFLKPEEILFFKAVENYTEVYVSNNRNYLIYQNLSQIETNPPISGLFRIHRSFIINTSKLCEYRDKKHSILLEESHCLPIAKIRTKEFEKEILKQA